MDIEKLQKISDLRDRGILTESEFEEQKRKIMNEDVIKASQAINWQNITVSIFIAIGYIIFLGMLKNSIFMYVNIIVGIILSYKSFKLRTNEYEKGISWFWTFILIIFLGPIILGFILYKILQIKDGKVLKVECIKKEKFIILKLIICLFLAVALVLSNNYSRNSDNNDNQNKELSSSQMISKKILNSNNKTKINDENNKKLIEIKSKLPTALKAVKKQVDDFADRTIYESRNSIENWKDDCYLKLRHYYLNNTCDMFWHIDYYASDWLFIESFEVKADNKKYYVSIERYDDVSTNVSGGSIWEYIRLPFEKNEDVIRAIANSKNVSIRFYGRQYYDDRKLSNAKIKALKNMLILYDACKAGYLNK